MFKPFFRVFQEMLYGIQTGFGSPQVPVAELLARPVPTLLSPQKPKSSNFLQVPDMESPRYVENAQYLKPPVEKILTVAIENFETPLENERDPMISYGLDNWV